MIAILLLILSVCATANSYRSIGCYMASSDNNVLNHRALQDSQMTLEKCQKTCLKKGYAYFGLLEGDKCYCGNKLQNPQVLDAESCAWRCAGNPDEQCGSDQGILILAVSDKATNTDPQSVRDVLLFSIRAHCGKSALREFRRPSWTELPPQGKRPELFRSSLLDNLPSAIRKYNAKQIVVEMRKGGKQVAMATFDVSYDIDSLNMKSWFSARRLVKSFPFWVGNSENDFVDFGVEGHSNARFRNRRFYIQLYHGGCHADRGLMGIGEAAPDPCSWVSNGGRIPVLFYATRKGKYDDVVDYADNFLIYMN